MADDARYRQRVFLDTYITDSNLTLDNGTTEAAWISHYADPEYSIERVFGSSGKDVDLAIAVGDPRTTPHLDYLHVPYKYEEVVPLTLAAKNKSGLTAVKLLWKAEQELREIAEDNGGYLRHIRSTRPSRLDLGSYLLHQVEVELAYVRSSEVIPTVPKVTTDGTNYYIFPNVLDISYPNSRSGDTSFLPPSRFGNKHQHMGDPSLQIQITCDVSSNPATVTWLRPQATTPKTDKTPLQFLLDIKQGSGSTASQKLDLGWGSFMNVRLVDFDLVSDRLTCTFEEYRSTSGDTLTTKTRWGIT
jgi:hypothetical protein